MYYHGLLDEESCGAVSAQDLGRFDHKVRFLDAQATDFAHGLLV